MNDYVQERIVGFFIIPVFSLFYEIDLFIKMENGYIVDIILLQLLFYGIIGLRITLQKYVRRFYMTIQEMKQRKAELGYTNKDIARMYGVPFSTVAKLFCGAVSSPRRATILALESVLSSTSREYPSDTSHRYGNNDTGCPALQDPGTPYQNGSTASSEYRKQGEYTLEDYLALPDDQRVDLIDEIGRASCRERV